MSLVPFARRRSTAELFSWDALHPQPRRLRTHPRPLQHPRARIHADALNLRIGRPQCCQKAPIPFSDQQRAPGRRNRTQKSLAASLQFSSRQHPFHPAIMRCQEIEICRPSGLPSPPACRHQRPIRAGHHIPGIFRGPHDVRPDYLKQHRPPRPMRRDFSGRFFLRCKVVPPAATNLHESNAQKPSLRAGQKQFPSVK